MKQTDILITEAKKLLTDNPYDAAHDLTHHQRVWQNARDIAHHTKEVVNINALKIACFWHDVVFSGDEKHGDIRAVDNTAKKVRERMIDSDFSNTLTEKVFIAIKYHEYERTPKNPEGKVLYDADKLDVIHLDRATSLLNAYDSGEISQETLNTYINTITKWLPELRHKYQYDYTRSLHDAYINVAQNDPKTQVIGEKLNLDWQSLLQSSLS